ncbi:MAG: hypothetical protein K2N34_11890, partial [Lachnospiraceae bacterium]|nr:hypothetical protein [Lachnospiraceae bacterium]
DKHKLMDNECLKMVYHDIYMQQQYNCAMLLGYMVSPIKNKKWFFSRNGLKFAVKCILHYK